MSHKFGSTRVRASDLRGRSWLNTGGQQLSLQQLRGKIVILDFWTFCCMNCLHVLDELRPLEEEFADVLVTIGVHSPKFEHEADPQALAAAVDRYDITHPVLDDPDLLTWQAYTARAWPTVVVVDPEGYIVAHLSGEGHVAGLSSLIRELVSKHERQGSLHRGSGPYVPRPKPQGPLAFPGKALELPEDLAGRTATFLVTDTARHRLVQLDSDLETVISVFGSGQKGYADGSAELARFNEPQGLVLLPAPLRAEVGYDLLIADSVNHRIRSLNFKTGQVLTQAGSGVQALIDSAKVAARRSEDPLELALSSPWDLTWSDHCDAVLIAMAGTHQIYSFDPRTGRLELFAGTGDEGLKDGPLEQAWFAQTSGICQGQDGTIWLADSETSALRCIRFTDQGPRVETAIGVGLFDFGFVDGDRQQARLQHCLGLTVLPDGSIAIADTYNGAIRHYNPVTEQVTTLAQGLAEPSDLLVEQTEQGTGLLVVEANAHQLVRLNIPEKMQRVDRGASQTARPATLLDGSQLTLRVRFAAPSGQKLDTRWGDPTQLKVSSTPEDFIVSGGGTGQGLRRQLTFNPDIKQAVLHITARAAACDSTSGDSIAEHAACHLYQQDWGIPVALGTGQGEGQDLVLDLRGLND